MSENASSDNDLVQMLRDHQARYVVDAEGHPFAVLLTMEEYDHFLDLLEDEADSQDDELATRLVQAASRLAGEERQTFRDYLHHREASRTQVQS
jgi:PHD/YefM family antitoxin component YafN of YafNO toxin-antitoxin module